MRIEMSCKNYEASEKLKDILEKKVSKLAKYFDDETKVKVVLKKENYGMKMEISIEYQGKFMRAEETGDNFYDIIDLILPKIEKQIYRHRTKIEKNLKSDAFFNEQVFSKEKYDIQPESVVKVKNFELVPMSIDVAIEQIDMLGHDFFVFLDEITSEVRVIYRRNDGNIGLIVPKL